MNGYLPNMRANEALWCTRMCMQICAIATKHVPIGRLAGCFECELRWLYRGRSCCAVRLNRWRGDLKRGRTGGGLRRRLQMCEGGGCLYSLPSSVLMAFRKPREAAISRRCVATVSASFLGDIGGHVKSSEITRMCALAHLEDVGAPGFGWGPCVLDIAKGCSSPPGVQHVDLSARAEQIWQCIRDIFA